MIIGILSDAIVSAYDFVELLDSCFIVVIFVISVSHIVIIGIGEPTFFTFIVLQVRDCFFVFLEVEVAFAYNLIELRYFLSIFGFSELFLSFGDSFLIKSLFEVHIGLEVRHVFGE